MLQIRLPRLTASHELYLAILRENPDARLERSARGELIFVPPTGYEGSIRNAEFVRQLSNWNAERRLGSVTEANGAYLLPNGATRVPDAAWVSRDRERTIAPARRESFATICPDFAVELLSASDNLAQTREKVAEFIENGTRLGWLIDPFRKAVELYRPDGTREVREDPLSVEGEDVLPGFVLDLTPIFDA